MRHHARTCILAVSCTVSTWARPSEIRMSPTELSRPLLSLHEEKKTCHCRKGKKVLHIHDVLTGRAKSMPGEIFDG